MMYSTSESTFTLSICLRTSNLAKKLTPSYRFTPQPAGAGWVHTHVMAISDLTRSAYTGKFVFVYVEAKNNSGQSNELAVPLPIEDGLVQKTATGWRSSEESATPFWAKAGRVQCVQAG